MIDQQQQVNVPELQRLNEAILLTMDAIRRVAPHLAQQVPFPMMGIGGPQIDPITAAYLQHQVQQQALRAMYGGGYGQIFGQPWGQSQWGQPVWQTIGQHPLLQQLLQQHLYQQHLFGQQPFGQVPFGIGAQYPQLFGQQGVGQQLPWQQLGQVPFGFGTQFPVGQQYGSPVNYGAQRPF
jgi:hypothetical protein